MASSGSPTTQARILVCAESLFGERGYDAVTVADIARACDVSTALIYYHFADKESLLRSLIERSSRVFDEPIRAALGHQGEPRERIELFIAAWIEAVHANASLVRILLRPLTDPAGPLAGELLAHISATIDALAATIAEGVARGDFAEETDPWLAAECLYGLVNTRVTAGALDVPYEERTTSDVASVTSFVTRVFLQGIARC